MMLLSIENDILYKFESAIADDEEYCKKYLLAYSSLDILEDVLLVTNKDFLYAINKNSATVSVHLFRSGIKLMLVTEGREKDNVLAVAKSLMGVAKKFLFGEWSEHSGAILSRELDASVKGILDTEHARVYNL